MPDTFDEAVHVAIWDMAGDSTPTNLAATYHELKGFYFSPDGTLRIEGDVDWFSFQTSELVNALFRCAKHHAKLTIDTIADTVISKQHDYGHDNIAQFGEVGLVVRLADKVARIGNLAGREAQNESLRDSYLDVCGYTVLFRMWRDGTFLLPLAGTEEESDASESGDDYPSVEDTDAWLESHGAIARPVSGPEGVVYSRGW